MKNLLTTLLALIIITHISSCQSNVPGQDNCKQTQLLSKVRGYYFHRTRRCMTCITVENVTKEILNEYYSSELKDNIISFKTINIDESNNKALAKDLRITGQTLLFISDSDTVNLTNQAFMNAVSNPLKLSSIITEEIDRMLK